MSRSADVFEQSEGQAQRPYWTALRMAGVALKCLTCVSLFSVLGATVAEPAGLLLGGGAGGAGGRYWGWIVGAVVGLVITRRAKLPFFHLTKKTHPPLPTGQSTAPVPESTASEQETKASSRPTESPVEVWPGPKAILVDALLFGGIGFFGGAMLSVWTFLVWSSVALSPWAPKDWGAAVYVSPLSWSTSHPAALWAFLAPMATCTIIGLIGGAIWGSTKWAFR